MFSSLCNKITHKPQPKGEIHIAVVWFSVGFTVLNDNGLILTDTKG